jgi:L-seryl-tRNA(Ser) seleniumtransferase
MADSSWGNVYKELGAKPIINAIGSVTMLGGSTPVPEVAEAMEGASAAYIPLAELEEKAGQVIADLADVPAAYVTSGAGSALTLVTAAIMAGDDEDRIQQLPNTAGMKDEILIQRRQRYWYDRCLELAGARLVEFGNDDATTREDLETAIGSQTAAVHYYAVEQSPDPDALSLEDTIEIAHRAGVPVIVDAAGQIYPLENFGKYVRMGADFQCIAAKYMGASQSTGLALGTHDIIRKLSYQSFVGYESRRIRGVGRPQKIDRQEIVGVVAAVRRWFTMNHEERLARVERQCLNVMEPLKGIPGLKVEMGDSVIGHQPFGVNIEVDSSVAGMTALEVVDKLKAGDPPVWTRVRESENFITIHGFGLNEGEDKIVGERIAALFSR